MRYDFLNAGLYPAAWAAYKANFLNMIFIAIGFVILDFLVPILGSSSGTNIGSSMLQILTAFFIHQTIISGKLKHWKETSPNDTTFIGFMIRSFGFGIIIFILVIILMLLPFMLGIKGDTAIGIGIIFGIVIGTPIYGFILSYFGTILPATIAQGDRSVAAATQRGRKTFWYTFSRLCYGSALFFLAYFALLYILGRAGLPLNVYSETGGISIVGTLLSIPFYMSGIFGTALAATALCQAYLRYEQRPDQTQDTA